MVVVAVIVNITEIVIVNIAEIVIVMVVVRRMSSANRSRYRHCCRGQRGCCCCCCCCCSCFFDGNGLTVAIPQAVYPRLPHDHCTERPLGSGDATVRQVAGNRPVGIACQCTATAGTGTAAATATAAAIASN